MHFFAKKLQFLKEWGCLGKYWIHHTRYGVLVKIEDLADCESTCLGLLRYLFKHNVILEVNHKQFMFQTISDVAACTRV